MGTFICIIVTAIIVYLIAYPLGYDTGYAQGRRDEGQEQAIYWKEEELRRWRVEAARKRMKEDGNAQTH